MPESQVGKAAEGKGAAKRAGAARTKRDTKSKALLSDNRAWVPPTFIAVGLLGVLWLVVYYIASPYIPFMAALGGWNMLIGLSLMAASFFIATLWK